MEGTAAAESNTKIKCLICPELYIIVKLRNFILSNEEQIKSQRIMLTHVYNFNTLL